MQETEIIKILEMPDESLDVDLISDEEVEHIMNTNFINNCASIGFLSSLQGACCCAQVDSSCIDGNSPDTTCVTVLPNECA